MCLFTFNGLFSCLKGHLSFKGLFSRLKGHLSFKDIFPFFMVHFRGFHLFNEGVFTSKEAGTAPLQWHLWHVSPKEGCLICNMALGILLENLCLSRCIFFFTLIIWHLVDLLFCVDFYNPQMTISGTVRKSMFGSMYFFSSNHWFFPHCSLWYILIDFDWFSPHCSLCYVWTHFCNAHLVRQCILCEHWVMRMYIVKGV